MSASCLLFSAHSASGQPILAAVLSRVYRIIDGSRVSFEHDAQPVLEPTYSGGDYASISAFLTRDTDLFAPLKATTDVIVDGSAHSLRGKVTSVDTFVRVGPLFKEIRVTGDRTIDVDAQGNLRFSSPEPFESLPLTWDRAYGGRDPFAEEALFPQKRRLFTRPDPRPIIAYPRNPAGTGFFVDMERSRLSGARAPNLEDPSDPVFPHRLLARSALDWINRPAAACYQPLDWLSFPRGAFIVEFEHEPTDRPLYEIVKRALAPGDIAPRNLGTRPDPRVYQCAPAGLGGACLRGGEPVRLRGLSPHRETLDFHLPIERPRFLVEPPGCDALELSVKLATVRIEPDADRITMSWTGTTEVAAEFPDEMCSAMRRAVLWSR